MELSEYGQYDALGLAELVEKKEVTAGELAALAVEATEKLNPELNAVVNCLDEESQERIKAGLPDGPFSGVPFVIKEELCHMAGVPLSMGSRLAEGLTLDYDSELMSRFANAGLVPVGTTTLPELGFGPTAEAVLYGPTHNPWKRGFSAGGSSGGSAAAVAAGIAPVGYSNDGGGSIRIPASNCGLVGLKPTRGRLPTGPDNGELLSGLGVEGVVTRSVRDTAAIFDAISGPDAGCYSFAPAPDRPFLQEVDAAPSKLRIAWFGNSATGEKIHPEVTSTLHETVKICEELGHELIEASPEIDGEAHLCALLTIWSAFIGHGVNTLAEIMKREPGPDTLEQATLAAWEHSKTLSVHDFLVAQDVLTETSRSVGRFYTEYDVLLSPVCSVPPPAHGVINQNAPGITAEQWVRQIFGYACFTGLQNTTGQPAISLPLGMTSDNLPIGMQFAGRFADEATLFRLAGQIEKAQPWAGQHPPIYVG